ncbi:MAG: hypothetical protein ABIG32_03965 [Candidatus Uhrbacteria bacterium]|nr:hypothetical protein [Patescibacteria group bacterium]MBU1906707.1 hypothetical protein [Patescibacteria group bacterium]
MANRHKRAPSSDSLGQKIIHKMVDILMMEGGPKLAKGWGYMGFTQNEVNAMLADQPKWRVSREMKRLSDRGFLKAMKQGEEMQHKLTTDGATLVLRELISRNRKTLSKGTLCYLIFDIPEAAKDTRYVFRQIISDANFKMVQRSVWSSQYDVAENLSKIIKLTGMEKWAKVIVGKEI